MKKHIGLKIFGIIIGVLAIFMATINIIPPKKVLEDNPFINKEKLLIIIGIFILLNISLFVVYQQSIYSQAGYSDAYPNAGLEFFYYISGIEILMLLRPQRCEKDRKSKSEKAFRIFLAKYSKI